MLAAAARSFGRLKSAHAKLSDKKAENGRALEAAGIMANGCSICSYNRDWHLCIMIPLA